MVKLGAKSRHPIKNTIILVEADFAGRHMPGVFCCFFLRAAVVILVYHPDGIG